jgi:hypothetical protein
MSITRLQQARQMFRYGGDTMGGPNDKGNQGLGDTGDFGSEKANTANTKSAETNLGMDNRDRAISNQYKNMPTPTVTIGVDKFDNPIKVKTTYTERRNRQKALDALNKQGISSFDPRVTKKNINFLDPNNLMTSFAPQQKKFGLLDLALIAATGGLFGTKLATGAKMFNTAKNISKFAETIGLTDKNVVNAFTSNFTDKISNLGSGKKSTKDEDIFTGGGDGIEGLGNNDALNQEYLLLLNKFNTGVFTDADQVRFTFLQKILGK